MEQKWKRIIYRTGGSLYAQYRGLSTWEKPTQSPETGDELIEMDTGNVFMFDGENAKWWPL